MLSLRRAAPVLACCLCLTTQAVAQDRGAAALGAALRGLGVNTRVLVIGAHPDDEDTQVIAWLSRGRHVETAYLSLTRGDGGQNAIGNELGEALGVIRTEELLAARRVDGGKQFFTRAYDYGFSKNAEEAFTQWPHDSLLRDVMTVVRAFKPHVIISVFTGTPRDGHGQHQAAGILAREAYDWSGDTARLPRAATAGYGAWTVSKFYRGASFRRDNATLSFNVGEYDPLSGRSWAEIAAISRSQHRSQAFGTLQPLGVRFDYLQREASRAPAPADPKAERSIFDGIDTTWARFRPDARGAAAVAALDSIPDALVAARRAFDPFAPDRLIPALGRISRLANAVSAGATRSPESDLAVAIAGLQERIGAALSLAAGVALEATASRELWAIAETSPINLVIYNRGRRPIILVNDGVVQGDQRSGREQPSGIIILPDSSLRRTFDNLSFTAVTAPRWLSKPRRGAMLDYAIFGDDEASFTAANAWVDLRVDSVPFRVSTPVVYRYADQVLGEIRRPIAAVPAIAVMLDQELEYAPARAPIERELRVRLQGTAGNASDVRVTLRLPQGLTADSAIRTVNIPPTGVAQTVLFRVRGQLPPGRHVIEVSASDGRLEYSSGYSTIDHEHIHPQRMYRASRLTLEAVNLAAAGQQRVAYIQGVGDNSASALEQLGLKVTRLDPAQLGQADLRGYSAIVVGPRAYEASPALVANNARLLDYVRDGGTLVVQYGQYEMQQPGIMPYPITINRPHDRVTVEDVPVTILDSTAAILRSPNRITARDFDGWMQDRSLYMPRTFDPAYVPVLEMSDPGEPANRGALLVASLGKGTYVYTTLAFFRQLPNGVPGAARLFVNLLAARATRTAQ